jgi:hypothetical protein
MMIDFAKLHCKAQLKAILENVNIDLSEVESVFGEPKIDKDSIINAYNLNNIK